MIFNMNLIQALILGIVEGITEFLPSTRPSKIKCAVEEIGKNSVIPSTIPRIRA